MRYSGQAYGLQFESAGYPVTLVTDQAVRSEGNPLLMQKMFIVRLDVQTGHTGTQVKVLYEDEDGQRRESLFRHDGPVTVIWWEGLSDVRE